MTWSGPLPCAVQFIFPSTCPLAGVPWSWDPAELSVRVSRLRTLPVVSEAAFWLHRGNLYIEMKLFVGCSFQLLLYHNINDELRVSRRAFQTHSHTRAHAHTYTHAQCLRVTHGWRYQSHIKTKKTVQRKKYNWTQRFFQLLLVDFLDTLKWNPWMLCNQIAEQGKVGFNSKKSIHLRLCKTWVVRFSKDILYFQLILSLLEIVQHSFARL